MFTHKTLGIALAVVALAAITVANSANAAIMAGDVIGFDFGTDDGSQANFNILAAPADVTVEDVIRVSDGTAIAGVDFTFDDTPDNSGENNASVVAPNFDLGDAAEDDVWFESNAGQWTLTFTGLDDSLIYNLTIGSQWASGNTTQNENRNTGWQIGATQLGTDADVNADSYVTFSGVSSSSGTLVISTYDLNSNTVSTLSALTLTAVPAPAALPAGIAMLGLVAMRRRRM